jgi:hypothetical protein
MKKNGVIKKISIISTLIIIALVSIIINLKKEEQTKVNENPIKIELKKLNIEQKSKNFYKIENESDIKDSKISIKWRIENSLKELEKLKLPEKVTLQLKNEDKVIKKVSLDEKNDWSISVTELTKELSSTEEYTLEVDSSQKELQEFTSSYVIDKNSNLIINLRTSHIPGSDKIPFTCLEINKVWDDNNNEAGKRPSELKFAIYDVYNQYEIETFTLSEEEDWTYFTMFEPIYIDDTSSGFRIVEITQNEYYKSEIIENFDPLGGFYEGGDSVYTVTNTFTPLMKNVQFKIIKNWDDNSNTANKRPNSIEIGLYGSYKENDSENAKLIDTITLDNTNALTNNTNSWQKITEVIETEYDYYYIKEHNIDSNYTLSIEPIQKVDTLSISYIQSKSQNNSMRMGQESSVYIVKNWDDNSNEKQKRPDEITIELYHSNVNDEDTKALWGRIKLSENDCTIIEDTSGYLSSDGCFNSYTANAWRASIANFNEAWAGYLWIEETTNQYYDMSYEVEYDTDTEGGGANIYITNTYSDLPISSYEVTLTNTYKIPEDKLTIGITKYWNDNNNKNGKQPETITLQLLADGNKIKDIELTAFDNWYTTISDLPKYNNSGNLQSISLEHSM